MCVMLGRFCPLSALTDFMDERNNGNLKVLSQVNIHKMTFRSGIQQGLAVVDSGCPLHSYWDESCGPGFLQG